MNSLVKKLGLKTAVVTDTHPEHKILVLDSQYESLYLSINKLAATICHTPIAMITFLHDQHVWMVSGADYSEIVLHAQKEIFYNWAIASDHFIEIPDISLVTQQSTLSLNSYYPHLKFYAGVPLKLPLGEVIGVLSVLDTKPNSLNQYQKNMLLALADVVTKSLVFKHHLLSI